MVGLDKFREAFGDYSDNYVIIGGTACDIVMTGTVVRPRATHDIDMIIVVESMTQDFGLRFWNFIKEAGYRPERRKTEAGEPAKYELYRFVDGKEGYPEMIELLSRHPDVLGEPKDLVIEPLPLSEDLSSLSAIIIDEDFYYFTITHSVLTNKIRHADPVALIALKAKAYLNLIEEKKKGVHVNTRNIKKHRSDVLKNAVIVEDSIIRAPKLIVDSIRKFVTAIRTDSDNLFPALAKSIDAEEGLVADLLNELENLFIEEQ